MNSNPPVATAPLDPPRLSAGLLPCFATPGVAGPRHPAPLARRNRLAGVGLIEVLVALTILSVGLLGIAAMQILALRNNTSAADRSMAVILSYSIIDSLRGNREAALAGDYNLAFPETGCELPEAGTLASNDLRAWLDAMVLRDTDNGIRGVMGAGACGSVACEDTGACTIVIRWDDCRGIDQDNCQTRTLTTQVQL
jgi:type IV pilus assembly protein PilV